VQFVPFRFLAYRDADDFNDPISGKSLTKHCTQVGFLPGEKAGPQLPVGGDAEPVAAWAKMAAYRTDNPDLAGGPFILKMKGRAVALAALGPDKRSHSLKSIQNHRRRDELAVKLALLERHELDEPDMERIPEGQTSQILNFIVIHPVEDDRVELDR